MIQKRFGLDIPVFFILQEKLQDILSKAPDWWGTSDKDIYDKEDILKLAEDHILQKSELRGKYQRKHR